MTDISPLFALEAEQLLLSGFVEEAIELCEKGLTTFPDYPAAQVILAKLYHLVGKQNHSNEILLNAKTNNYGKIFDKCQIENTPTIINQVKEIANNDLDTIINDNQNSNFDLKNRGDANDIINTTINSTELIDIDNNTLDNDSENVLAELNDTNILYSLELDNFNNEFKSIVESIDDTSKLTNLKNKNNLTTTIDDGLKIDNNLQIESEQSESLEQQKSNLDYKNSIKILDKNKDYFFHSNNVDLDIANIENDIIRSINNYKTSLAIINKRKDLSNLNEAEKSNNINSVILSLIDTRLINNKNNNIEKSNNESNLPILTETMAKIYIAQGAKNKAIDVYKKLIIKEPNKRDYYTQQIQNLS